MQVLWCDPLPDRLQPFDENLVDEEELRGDRVEENEDFQDDDQEREGVVAQGERAFQSAGGTGTRTDIHPLPQLVVYTACEEQGDPMRIADEQDKMRKKENNI